MKVSIRQAAAGLAAALLLGWFCGAARGAEPSPAPTLELIYSGNRRSQLEPCGCKSNMQGGIQYEANYIASQRAEGVPLLLVDSGGFVGQLLNASQYLKTRYLVKAMGAMGYDVVNVSRADAVFGLDFLREAAKAQGFEFVSATVLDPTTLRPVFRPYVIKEYPGPAGGKPFRIAFTGFAVPDSPAPKAALDLEGTPVVEEGSPAGTAPAVSTPTPTPAPSTPTPTPRVSPTPTLRQMGVLESAPGHEAMSARGTPTPPPGAEAIEKEFLERQKRMQEARQRQMTALREKLTAPETSFNPGPPAPSPPPAAPTETATPKAESTPQPSPSPSPAATPAHGASPTSGPSASIDLPPRPKGREFVIADPVDALSQVVPFLRERADYVVVLGHFPETNALAVLDQVKGIDLMIVGYGSPMAEPPKETRGALVASPGFDGRVIGQVKLAYDATAKRYGATGKIVPINSTLKADPTVEKLVEEYKEDTRKLAPPQQQAATRYTLAGVETCRNCHLPEYGQWSTTQHAHAIDTLTEKNQQYNPECLPCHVTYYNVDNGFRSLSTTPQFVNVQCEVCHGPSMAHVRYTQMMSQASRLAESQKKLLEQKIEESRPIKTPDEKTCLKCHTPENDDNFVYAVKIEKVRHLTPTPASQPAASGPAGMAETRAGAAAGEAPSP